MRIHSLGKIPDIELVWCIDGAGGRARTLRGLPETTPDFAAQLRRRAVALSVEAPKACPAQPAQVFRYFRTKQLELRAETPERGRLGQKAVPRGDQHFLRTVMRPSRFEARLAPSIRPIARERARGLRLLRRRTLTHFVPAATKPAAVQ